MHFSITFKQSFEFLNPVEGGILSVVAALVYRIYDILRKMFRHRDLSILNPSFCAVPIAVVLRMVRTPVKAPFIGPS